MNNKDDVRTTLLINKEALNNIKTIASLRNTTQQDLFKEIIDNYLINCEEMKYIKQYKNKQ